MEEDKNIPLRGRVIAPRNQNKTFIIKTIKRKTRGMDSFIPTLYPGPAKNNKEDK